MQLSASSGNAPLSPSKSHAAALASLDAAMAAFARESAVAFEIGEALARADSHRLIGLADRLVANARDWRERIGALEIAIREDLELDAMVVLVLQTVFDESLTADALDVLNAAIRVALSVK